jgi:hypothetical protein
VLLTIKIENIDFFYNSFFNSTLIENNNIIHFNEKMLNKKQCHNISILYNNDNLVSLFFTRFVLLLFILFIFVILISPLACADYKHSSTYEYYMGIDMNLPQDAVIKLDGKAKTVILLKGENLSTDLEDDENFKTLQSTNKHPEIALAFLSTNHSLFQLVAPPDELSIKSLKTDELGFTHIKFQQSYKGIPVWASEINLHLNQQNQVYLIQGRYIPTPINVNTQPALTEDQAISIVAEKLGRTGPECPRCQCEIIIYADNNIVPCLSYRIEANPSLTEGWEFFIDATSGDVLKKLPTVFNDKSQMGQIKMVPPK